MTVRAIIDAMETIAPLAGAESWDRVGLLIGSADAPSTSALLTIDLTDEVLAEAIERETSCVIAYHPPIFKPLTTLTDASFKSRIALGAARAGLAVYSPHSALDAAPGGVNDWLAQGLGPGDVRALTLQETLPDTEACKVVTFCPADTVERVRNGLASVGAGRIGDYELCSFETTGTGTFRGGPDTNPAVGTAGTLERADEVRLEMVCPRDALGLAVIMLRRLHPYEEPAFEIHPLLPRPSRDAGAGRRVVLDRPADLRTLVERVKAHLGVKQLRVAPGRNAPRKYETIGLCAGAGTSMLDAAVRQGCRLFLTGEMTHHDVLEAQARGCTVMLAGHTNTERGFLKILRKRLATALPEVDVAVSRRDGYQLRVM